MSTSTSRYVHFALTLTAIGGIAAVHAAESRTWTDSTGKLSVEAELIESSQGGVLLKRVSDGRQFRLPVAKLSAADQQYLKSLAEPSNSPEQNDSAAELVEVVADSALVKVGDEVIATARKGERFEVHGRSGPWLAVTVSTTDGERDGWIFAGQVRYAVEPGLSQDSPAPGAFAAVRMDVKNLQFAMGHPPALLVELALANSSTTAVEFDLAALVLEVDNESIPASTDPMRQRYAIRLPQPHDPQQPYRSAGRPLQASYLENGTVAPGSSVKGWVVFHVPQAQDPRTPLPEQWILKGTFAGREGEVDLKQQEVDMVGKIRPSTLEPSIEVLELGPRITLLNVDKLSELQDKLQEKNQSYIVLSATGNCLVDEPSGQRLLFAQQQRSMRARQQRSMRQRQQTPPAMPVLVNIPQDVSRIFGVGYRPGTRTEPEAVIEILGMNRSGGAAIVKHLSDKAAPTRAAAARMLVRYTREPGVVDALLQAIDDKDAGVRAAAARSLARTGNPAQAIPPLLDLLDDPEPQVVSAAAYSLGRLKSQEAVPRLEALATNSSNPAASAAAEALKNIGVLAELDAALRKLELGKPTPEDYAVLGRSKDKRAVEKLIEALQNKERRYNVEGIALALGELGDVAAVQPLIDQLVSGDYCPDELPRALGKLGDKRAIEPLQKAIQKDADGFGRFPGDEAAVHEALLMLDAPGVFEHLKKKLAAAEDYEKEELIRILARGGGDRAVPVIAPYLDNDDCCECAARELVANGSDAALAELKKRLMDKDYPHARQILDPLIDTRFEFPMRYREKTDDPRLERVRTLVDELRESPHERVRSSIGNVFGE